jgi:hypothetical protein
MAKIVFLFQRKAPQTHAEFGAHYLDHHAPLGLRVAVQMDGYTVNLVPGAATAAADLDAITETWTPSVEAFMDPQQAFRNEADMLELMTDDQSFIGTNRPYVVEEELVVGAWPDGPVREQTPGAKRISLHPTAATLPSPAPASDGLGRVVHNRVLQSLAPGAPEVAVFLLEWAPSPDAFAPLDEAAGVVSYLVQEHVQRQPKR